ncbi:MAG: cation-translocating P-type ATPase [Actinobacteria bacterium]|nr:cation-translocating P-type ATPase [Actinomycetota bacterium]
MPASPSTRPARWDASLLPSAEVLEQLGSDADAGLSSAEAAARLATHGPNLLRVQPGVPLWRRVLAQFADPLVYLLLVAVAISLVAWVAEGAHGWPVDVLVILAILVANAAIGVVQEQRAADAVAALARLTAPTATVLRDGRLLSVPAGELVPGDVLDLTEGDAVAADARLVAASGLRVLEAALTGESEAVTKDPAPLPARAGVGDRLDMVHRGTAVVQGTGRAVVTATGMDTEVGAIAELLESTAEEPSPLQRDLARVSKMLGAGVVAIAVVVMVVTAVANGVHTLSDAVSVLLLGVSLAVAAVPEGLPAILSLVLAIGVQRMAGRGAVVKRLHSVETLGSATVIASDKTGTLTRNEMTVQRVLTPSGEVELSGVGYRCAGAARVRSGELGPLMAEVELVVLGGALANNASVEESDADVEVHGDPTEAAFLVAARKLAGLEARARAFERRGDIPFTAERRLMSSVGWHGTLGRLAIVTKGAADVLLARCTAVQRGDEVVPLDEAERSRLVDGIERLSAQAYRVLGVGYAWFGPDEGPDVLARLAGEDATSLEQGLVYAGAVGIIDPPRAEVAAAIADARRAGVRVLMITGDHPATASRIATDLGIANADAPVTTGADLDSHPAEWLAGRVRTGAVYARVAPAHKLALVRALQAGGQVVAMTGDGVNDAPALKAADIGVAMGKGGTEVSRDAADLVLADDNFATIVAAVREGRRIFANIGKFLRYLLSSNLGEVCTVFGGVVFAGALGLSAVAEGELAVPLLATQILWINLVTDSAPALAMGVDPEVDDVMARPPRRAGAPVIDRALWLRMGVTGLLMGLVALLAIDAFLPGGLVPGEGSMDVARTAGFTTLVFAQLFNAFNARSLTTSAFSGLFSNRWLWAAVLVGAVLQVAVVNVPWLQVAFGTVPLELSQWAICVGLASVVLWADELVKLVLRRRS